MKKLNKIIGGFIVSLIVYLKPVNAFVDDSERPTSAVNNEFRQFIQVAIDYLLLTLGLFTVLFAIYAITKIFKSKKEKDKSIKKKQIKKGKIILIWSIVLFVIVIAMWKFIHIACCGKDSIYP